MPKPLLYRLFKIGRVPKQAADRIAQEGLVFQQEGIAGSITFRNFRAPGKYFSWRRKWFLGSVVLTREGFRVFWFSNRIISVPWDSDRLSELRCRREGEDTVIVGFDASTCNQDWSGEIEVRLSTSSAVELLETFEQYAA